jgi:hypothetical protein
LLVDIPADKNIHTKKAGVKGDKYVYIYARYFRDEDSKPRNKATRRKLLADSTHKLKKCSHKYFDIYNIEPTFADDTIWDYGYSYLVTKSCHDIGLFDCLFQTFGSLAEDLIVMAAYIIRNGNAMDGLDDWQCRKYFPDCARLLTSRVVSEIFGSLSFKRRPNALIQGINQKTNSSYF